jgi:7-carboxy-7-deazaguanine synthase
MSPPTLRLIETYLSIQGESTKAGLPCVFVRTAGCNLRCTWCDSTWTFTGGEHKSLDDIVADVKAFGVNLVEVTGGEPLVHRECFTLMTMLADQGFDVMVETSGSISVEKVDKRVHIVMDLKAPDSGEDAANLWSNINYLKSGDDIKIVLASRADYEWAIAAVREHDLSRFNILFSPVHGALEAKDLAAWIIEDKAIVRMQLQMHKSIWPPEMRGV